MSTWVDEKGWCTTCRWAHERPRTPAHRKPAMPNVCAIAAVAVAGRVIGDYFQSHYPCDPYKQMEHKTSGYEERQQ